MLDRIRRAIAPPPPAPRQAGGLDWSAIYPDRHTAAGIVQPSYAPTRSVAAAIVSAILVPANPARRSLTIVNDGTANLYVNTGSFAGATLYHVKLGPGATFVLEDPDVYQGDVAGVWDVANGAARIRETT